MSVPDTRIYLHKLTGEVALCFYEQQMRKGALFGKQRLTFDPDAYTFCVVLYSDEHYGLMGVKEIALVR